MLTPALLLLPFFLTITASPTPKLKFVSRQSSNAITALSTAQVSTFKPFTFFASAAYCAPNVTLTWSCGANCEGNPSFIPTASGGDGSDVQFWYVGFDPALSTVIVAHQGTNEKAIQADLTDADFFLGSLDSTLFPGLSSSIEVHSGFRNAQANTATAILAAVQQTMSTHSATHVTVVGHSLGAAISLLDFVYLPLHLPASTTFTYRGYGLPRVGNQAFANYVDAHATDLAHVNNKEDPVPILPGMFLGFHHPSGEKHIMDDNTWVACPGQDNPSDECTTGDVETIFNGNVNDHDGPYDGVVMGC